MDEENVDVNTSENVKPTYEELETRLHKAEGKIVSLKKDVKAPTENEDASGDKEEAKEENTKDENPSEQKAEPKEAAKTVSQLEQELAALKAEQETKANVETTNMMGIGGTSAPSAPSEYSVSQLEKMTQAEYNEAKDIIDRGEATLIRD